MEKKKEEVKDKVVRFKEADKVLVNDVSKKNDDDDDDEEEVDL